MAETKNEREIAIHIASPGMVATELLLGGDKDARASKWVLFSSSDCALLGMYC